METIVLDVYELITCPICCSEEESTYTEPTGGYPVVCRQCGRKYTVVEGS